MTRVSPVGMADRVCVDLASMLVPGEGMLVGSFSRSLFLVHSECMESAYINRWGQGANAGGQGGGCVDWQVPACSHLWPCRLGRKGSRVAAAVGEPCSDWRPTPSHVLLLLARACDSVACTHPTE